jgi:hypothetical protein
MLFPFTTLRIGNRCQGNNQHTVVFLHIDFLCKHPTLHDYIKKENKIMCFSTLSNLQS